MIRAIARASVNNPVAANLAMLALLLSGVVLYRRMPREVFPDFSLNQVEVFTVFPGAAPEDVERLVTVPLEEAVESVDGLDEMVSTSREGVSRLLLTLEEGADVGTFIEDVRSAVTRGDVELPGEAEDPWVREILSTFPVISVFVYGFASEEVLRELADEHQRELDRLEGVSRVVLTGSRDRRVWIEVDPAALERYGLSLAEVGRIVREHARDVPLGSLSTGQSDWLLRMDAGLYDAEELFDVPVRTGAEGHFVRLGDVARLSDTFERSLTRARFNGQPCFYMQVMKKDTGDSIEIASLVRDYVDKAQRGMPPGTALGTNTDLSIYVASRLHVMKQSGALGAVLVLAALLLFLNLRVAIVTAVGIPVAFLGGILLAGLFGVTMNMITMFGLIVVLGMIVDDAIVVGENAFRLIEEEGYSPEEAAVEGTAQVGGPVVATVLTSVAAFLPVLLLDGTTGQFMRPLPLIVSFCLLISVVEALLIMPAHIAHWTRRRSGAQRAEAGPAPQKSAEHELPPARRWYDPLRDGYVRLLESCLRWRYLTLALGVSGALVIGGIARWWIPFVFFDDFESKLFYVSLRTPSGTSLDDTEKVAIEVEKLALAMPTEEVESVNTLIGVSASDSTHYEIAQDLAQVWIELTEASQRERGSADIVEELRRQIDALPVALESYEIAQPQSGPTGRAIELAVRGPDLDVLRALSEQLQTELAGYAGTRDIHDNLDVGKRELLVELTDRGRTLGLTEELLSLELRTAFEGSTHARFRRGKDDVEVVVKLPEAVRETRSELDELRISTPAGERVPLASVARITERSGPSVISHRDRERAVTVSADVNKAEGNSTAILEDLVARTEGLWDEHPGYRLSLEGDYEETQRTLSGLATAALISLVVIYFLLGTLFRSFLQPVVIMFIIPFAAVGMIGGHWALERPITMMSLIGLLALTGVVVNDSLILVDFVNARRLKGASLAAALVDAGRARFRPIVLTSVTTMLGLTPLTFFASGQARFLQPMAISIFFGLAAATWLVLLLVPVSYAVLEDLMAWSRRPRDVWTRMRAGREIHA